MATTLKQRVADKCEQLGCTLYEYSGSHFVVESKRYDDRRVWNNGSHYLTENIDGKPNEALRELLERMADGFNDHGGACADGDDCETCGGEA